MNYYIISGTSRGLGESLVKQLLTNETKVYCLSRSINSDLMKEAKNLAVDLAYYQVNVGDTVNVEAILFEIFKEIKASTKVNSITLINNAGVIEPITTAGTMRVNELKLNVETNLLAPMVLTNIFLQATMEIEARKKIVNISSGAAKNSYSGWSAYCATKAGLDMFTRTIGLEQEKAKFPTTVISFSPGIMDTDMQKTIRSKTRQEFEIIEKYQEYKERGLLRSTDFVAEVLLKLLNEHTLVNGEVYDIKQLI